MRSTVTLVVDIRPLSIGRLRDTPLLWTSQWEETAREAALMPLDPDWSVYERLEALGILLCLGVFDGEELVGYSLGIVGAHPSSQTVLHYNNLQFYVLHSHCGVGRQLYHASREGAAERGAKFILWRTKPGSIFDRLLHSWAALEEQENVFSEKL